MSSLFHIAVSTMGLCRIALGLAPFVAAGPLTRLLGFPSAHNTATARLLARFFGVRDIGLGVLAFYALRHPDTASFVFLFNAAMDLGDLVSVAIPLVKRDGIDHAAAMAALLAFTGGTLWLAAFLIAR